MTEDGPPGRGSRVRRRALVAVAACTGVAVLLAAPATLSLRLGAGLVSCLLLLAAWRAFRPMPRDGAWLVSSGDARRVLRGGRTLIVGRSSEAGLRLASEHVSRRHLELSVDLEGRARARDLGSAAGTRVGDAPLGAEAAELADDATLLLGEGPAAVRLQVRRGLRGHGLAVARASLPGLTGLLLLAAAGAWGLWPRSASASIALPWELLAAALSFAVLAGLLAAWRGRAFPTSNPHLLAVPVALTLLGLCLAARLGPDVATARGLPGLVKIGLKQAAWAHVGLLAFAVAGLRATPGALRRVAAWTYLPLLAAALLVGVTALFGVDINGRRLWMRLGPVQFQTVELVKVLVVLFGAAYVRDELPRLSASRRFGLPPFRAAASFGLLWMIAVLPLVLQRDIGPAALLSLTFLALLWLGTGSVQLGLGGLGTLAGLGALAWWAQAPSVAWFRIAAWLEPFSHSEALARCHWALAAGGPFGLGLGLGRPDRIPEVQSDFTFAAIVEELGAFGAVAVLALLAAFVLAGLRAARRQGDTYRRALAAGVATLLGLQALMILAGNVGLLPLTGITLPFVSYGGTGLAANFALAGLLHRLSAEEASDAA